MTTFMWHGNFSEFVLAYFKFTNEITLQGPYLKNTLHPNKGIGKSPSLILNIVSDFSIWPPSMQEPLSNTVFILHLSQWMKECFSSLKY